MTGDMHAWTIAEAARRLAAREVTSVELTGACLSRIESRNPATRAFILVMAETALAQAREADARIASGARRGAIDGVPLSLKDLIDYEGLPTTAASRVRAGHRAGRHAPVTRRLLDAGAVILGKTNLHEFAFGTTSEDSAYGAVRHPLDESRSPGGSSGGAAAAIVDGMCFGSIGTDTGGSIRIPAAVCGTVGLKPAYGEVPTEGVVPLSTTFDHVGPLARSVEDVGLLHEVLAGAPVWDTSGAGVPGGPPLRLAVLDGYFLELLDDEVRTAFEEAVDALQRSGAHIERLTLRRASDISSIYLVIQLADAAAYHGATLDAHADEYTRGVRLRLELGRYVLAEDYVRALQGRDALRGDVDAALASRDALLLPTVPIPAPRQGAATVRVGDRDAPVRAVMLRLTQPFNVTGHPALTMPIEPTGAGLPVGLQLVGHRGATGRLLHTARLCERWLRG